MRPSELVGRAGKQPDGSAKTREVKLCTAWSAESSDWQNRPVRQRHEELDATAQFGHDCFRNDHSRVEATQQLNLAARSKRDEGTGIDDDRFSLVLHIAGRLRFRAGPNRELQHRPDGDSKET